MSRRAIIKQGTQKSHRESQTSFKRVLNKFIKSLQSLQDSYMSIEDWIVLASLMAIPPFERKNCNGIAMNNKIYPKIVI